MSDPIIAPEYRQVIPLLALDRTIAFNVAFRKVAGSTVAALFLSQAWHWTKTEVAQQRDGWFYKTQEEWTEETGLSRKEQTTARKHLKENNLIEEERRGLDPTLWFRVSGEALAEAIRNQYQGAMPDVRMVHQVDTEPDISYRPNGASPHITEMTTQRTADISIPYEVEPVDEGMALVARSFHDFWQEYPRKEAKGAALKAWEKKAREGKITEHNVTDIIYSLDEQNRNNFLFREKQYIPLPASWLNGERWDDEIIKPAQPHQRKTNYIDRHGNFTVEGAAAHARGEI